MKHKNPFKGIACSNGSAYGPQYFRHIEGARDSRPAYRRRNRFDTRPFRDTNPHPVMFDK